MKKYAIGLMIISMFVLTSCGKEPHDSKKMLHENNTESSVTVERENDNYVEQNLETEENLDTEDQIILADYGRYFGDVNGCAIIYDAEGKSYSVYNEGMVENEVSPYSTFKIVGTLMGLNNGVLQDENSKMNYSGDKYPVDSWNGDLTLKQAVQTSCIWYFRQVYNKIGKTKVEDELKKLHYGNRDISQWEGSDSNPRQDLNGFWIGSSLKISPREQVDVLKSIFQSESIYSDDQINVLKNVMLYDEVDGYKIYGKTGTNQEVEGWYIGLAQKGNKEYYFAVYLNNENSDVSVSGSTAREIVINIFKSEF